MRLEAKANDGGVEPEGGVVGKEEGVLGAAVSTIGRILDAVISACFNSSVQQHAQPVDNAIGYL
jgi:hypothetical protein